MPLADIRVVVTADVAPLGQAMDQASAAIGRWVQHRVDEIVQGLEQRNLSLEVRRLAGDSDQWRATICDRAQPDRCGYGVADSQADAIMQANTNREFRASIDYWPPPDPEFFPS